MDRGVWKWTDVIWWREDGQKLGGSGDWDKIKAQVVSEFERKTEKGEKKSEKKEKEKSR